MRTFILILPLVIFGLHQLQANNGLEVYQVKKYKPNFTKNEDIKCHHCFDIKTEDLFDKPLLTEGDFKRFDWASQQIELTETGKQKLEGLEIPLQGLPVAMVLNGEIIYGFWFWNRFSSFGCDRVYTYPKTDFKLKFGLPNSSTFGADPRFDKRLLDYINRVKK